MLARPGSRIVGTKDSGRVTLEITTETTNTVIQSVGHDFCLRGRTEVYVERFSLTSPAGDPELYAIFSRKDCIVISDEPLPFAPATEL